MRRMIPLVVLLLFVAGCFHANVDTRGLRILSPEPTAEAPPPDASQREKDLYDYAQRLEKKLKDKDRKIDSIEDERDDLKDRVKSLEHEVKDLQKRLDRAYGG